MLEPSLEEVIVGERSERDDADTAEGLGLVSDSGWVWRSEKSAATRSNNAPSTPFKLRRMNLPPANQHSLRLDGFGIFALRLYLRTWT
jgi:hypothetical protein